MDLLNPGGLWWLGVLPLLLVPYLIRERPRRRIVAALFLYEGIEAARSMRLGGWPRLRPLFLLQLLLLLLAVAALCRPILRTSEIRSALVIDDSASLGAKTGSGETRFEAGRRTAAARVRSDPANVWDLFTLAEEPKELAVGLSRAEALRRIDALEPPRCRHASDSAISLLFGRLARGTHARVHVVSDRLPASAPAGGGRFDFATVGAPAANVAVTDVSLAPSGLRDRAVSLTAVAESFAPKAASVPISVVAVADGRIVASGRLELAARGTAIYSAEVPPGGRYRVRLDPRDALALDDEAEAGAPALGGRSVLLVSKAKGGLESLEKAFGIRLELARPEDYRPEHAAGQDLVVFHRAAPAEPPDAAALYLLPPEVPFLPKEAGRVAAPAIGLPLPTHPAVRYLVPGTLRPRQALLLEGKASWQPLAVTGSGPIILFRDSPKPTVVSGIDLLPYLGDRNRPVSILTLDLISWLLGENGKNVSAAEGGCLPLGRDESDLSTTKRLPAVPAEVAPSSERASTTPLWVALAAAALALLLVEGWLQGRTGMLPFGLRLATITILLAAVLDPARELSGSPPPPTVIVDASRSVLPDTREQALAGAVRRLGADAPAVVFAERPVGAKLGRAREAMAAAGESETDLEAALAAAAAESPDGGSLVLLSDGWETRGDARRALRELERRGLRVYPIALEQRLPGNLSVESLSLPLESAAAKPVRAEVWLRSDNDGPVAVRIVLRRGNREVHRAEVKLVPGENLVTAPVLITGEGSLEYTAELQTGDPAINRRKDDDLAKAWVSVRGRRRILVAGREDRDNRYLTRALEERGYSVRSVALRGGDPLPEARGFGAVVLNDVALADLPRSYPTEVRDYVRAGGGLVMVGGPYGFGLGGYRGSAIEDALPVGMKTRSHDEPRTSVALVIDKSGSMREEERMVFAKEAARQLVDHLRSSDQIAVIGFDREAFVVIPLREVGDVRDQFDGRISRLRPAGGTRLYPALEEARRQLLGQESKRRHVIVLSDGLMEDGETAAGRRRYYDLALALSQQGVTVSTIALGRDADTSFLDRLASYGRGAFHETSDYATLPELILGELEARGREKTAREEEIRPLASRDSPLVGEIARSAPRWPSVLGLVDTELKPRARLDVGVAEPGRGPLVASWEYGSGRSVAVTTDADGRWSDRWVRWSEWSRMWGSIADWLVPESEPSSSSYRVAYRDGELEIDYTRYDRDLAGTLTASVSGPGNLSAEMPMRRLAPGHHRASLATRKAGDYRIEVRAAERALTRPPLGYSLRGAESGEEPRRESNRPLLDQIAEATGGVVNPRLDEVLPGPPPVEREPLTPYFLPAALLIFLAELVLRRLRAD